MWNPFRRQKKSSDQTIVAVEFTIAFGDTAVGQVIPKKDKRNPELSDAGALIINNLEANGINKFKVESISHEDLKPRDENGSFYQVIIEQKIDAEQLEQMLRRDFTAAYLFKDNKPENLWRDESIF